MRDELRNTLELGLGTGISSLFRVAFVVYAGRVLGPAEYADFYTALSIGLLFAAATAPVAGSITRFLSLYSERRELARIAEIRALMPRRVARWSLALAVLVLAAAWPVAAWFEFRSPLTALLLAAIIPLNLMIDTPRGILRGLERYRSFGLSLAVESALRLAICVLALHFVRSAPAALVAQAAATAIVLWGTHSLLRRVAPASPIPADDTGDFRELDRFTLPLFGFAVLVALFQNVDSLLVKALFDSVEAGRFGAVNAFSKLVWLLFLPFGILALPRLTAEFAAQRSIWPALLRILGGFVLASGAVLALFLCCGPALLERLYGAAYLPGVGVLLPLTIAVALSVVAVLVGQAFAAMNRFRFLGLYGIGFVAQVAWMLAVRDSILGVVHAMIGAQVAIVAALLGLLFLTTRAEGRAGAAPEAKA